MLQQVFVIIFVQHTNFITTKIKDVQAEGLSL